MSEYTINTKSKADRAALLTRINRFGGVTDYWPDGTFDFKCHDDECETKML